MNRPKEFDAALLSYMPMLRTTSRTLAPSGKREEFIQDTLAYVLEHWTTFRGEGYGAGSGFHNWLKWQMRGVAANQRIKKRVNFVHNDRQMETAHVPADQERAVIAKDILDRATGREGAILLRRGMGFSLEEIGIDIGLCRERVRQLEDKGRSRLRKACGLKVAA